MPEFCEEHSGQKTLLKTLIGLVGTAVVLLLFVVGLTLSTKTEITTEMAKGNKELQTDLSKISNDIQQELSNVRERIAVLEFRIGVAR